MLPTPCQMGKHRYLYIGEMAAVSLGNSCRRIHYRLVLKVYNVFLPPYLGIVCLGIDGADGAKILLANIPKRCTYSRSSMPSLRHFRHHAHVTHGIARIEAYRQVVAMVANLCRSLQR